MNRRALLAGCGALVAGGTAGCLDTVPGLGDSSGISTGSPDAVVESYVNSVFIVPQSSPDTEKTVFHSTTVANTSRGDEPNQGQGQEGVDFEISLLEMQGPAVRVRGLSADQLRAAAQSWTAGVAQEFTPPEGFIRDLAAGETALVDVRFTLETSFESEQTDGEQTSEGTRATRAITAVEDGDWQIVALIPAGDQSGGS